MSDELTALRSRLEALESLAAKWEAQQVPASIYAAQLRALLAPAKSCDNCGETGCDREYDAGHNPCAKWRPAPNPPNCEECAHYGDADPRWLVRCKNERRHRDGHCGPEGRLFVRKGEATP
jgi:hypothetical protein